VVDTTMDAVAWLRKQLESGNEDLLREIVSTFAERVMSRGRTAVRCQLRRCPT
jgi:hypothetical protein